MKKKPTPETFTDSQIDHALRQWIDYGEGSFDAHALNTKGHRGYFSGQGWAARCLRFHLKQRLKASSVPNVTEKQPAPPVSPK